MSRANKKDEPARISGWVEAPFSLQFDHFEKNKESPTNG